MAEPAPPDSDALQLLGILAEYTQKRAAHLLVEARKRFDEERDELRREIAALRQQLAESADSTPDIQPLKDEIAQLRQQLTATEEALASARERAAAPVQSAPPSTPPEPEVWEEPEELTEPEAIEPEPEPEPEYEEDLAPAEVYDPEVDGERRQFMRRKGNPVPVAIDGPGWVEPVEGWVLDRGGGGLGLRMDQKLTPGMNAKIRSARQPTAPWIEMVVSYCQAEGGNFRIGCQFARDLSWPEQQQFG